MSRGRPGTRKIVWLCQKIHNLVNTPSWKVHDH